MTPSRTIQNGQFPASARQEAGASSDKCLTMLVEGAAECMPAIEAAGYKEFRETIGDRFKPFREGLSEAEKLAITKDVLQEFESYRNRAEEMLRQCQDGWRDLATILLQELLGSMGIRANSPVAVPLIQKIAELATGEEILGYRLSLDEFLHPIAAEEEATNETSSLNVTDRSTANDNAAGLRGGGSAVEHLRSIMARGGRGSVVFFRLGCLDIISERFGGEAAQDCLMAVAAYIAHSLHSDDVLFHWSDSALLAILQNRGNQRTLIAELQRIASLNREITIKIGGRSVMLRIPLHLEITPIAGLRDADDLYKITRERVQTA